MDNELTFKIIPLSERYYSEDSNWGVYNFTTKDDIPEFTTFVDEFFDSEVKKISQLAGKMQRLYIGSEYEVKAVCSFNKKFNAYQYIPSVVLAVEPKTIESQEVFLKSIVTERQAKALLEAYPDIVGRVLDGSLVDIDYSKVNGVREHTWNGIRDRILDNYVISDIICLLQPLGVTYNMIKRLIAHESNPVLLKSQLLSNPYIMTKIHGLGFKKVDALALKLNPELKVSRKRTVAFLSFYLHELGEGAGHTWATLEALEAAVRDNINECIGIYHNILESNEFLHIEGNQVGLQRYYDVEISICEILKDLNSYERQWEVDVDTGISDAEEEQGFTYTDEQKEIVKNAMNDNVVIIAGKAGTGKSTISRALLKIFGNSNYSISCCALSAKAAQRLKEATGHPASTIHRLLGAKGLNEFMYNRDNPLPCDVLLVDEGSMINARLFYDLLLAVREGTKVILCGDHKQLPPIGFGNVFSDLLAMTNTFNVNQLTTVLRQAEKSGVLTDANLIREGESPISEWELKIKHGESEDMVYMFRENREALNHIAVKTYLKSVETDGIDDVVLIVPRKKDCLNSTSEINRTIQDLIITEDVPMITRGSLTLKQGAKVIQRVNNYEKNVFNGEIGYIASIWKDEKQKNREMCDIRYKSYDDDSFKVVSYTKEELDQVDLAYAITAHLSQGSGYKTVIGIIDNTHFVLLDNCMLYTLLTRAKERCLLLAEPSAFIKSIRTNHNTTRQTWLKASQC